MIEESVVERIDGGKIIDVGLREFLDEVRNITGIGYENALTAGVDAQQEARGKSEDVIKRQRRQDGQLIDLFQHRLYPSFDLQHIGDEVAMLQDRALGNPGGSACVLKEGDVVGTKLRPVQQHPLASGDRCIERRGARQRIGRNHLLHPPYDEIDYGALHHAQQVAHGGDDDVLDVGLCCGAC